RACTHRPAPARPVPGKELGDAHFCRWRTQPQALAHHGGVVVTRYSPDHIQLTIREEGNRLFISWKGSAFLEVKASYRAWFGGHGESVYNGTARAWSMPLSARPRLDCWLSETFEHPLRKDSGYGLADLSYGSVPTLVARQTLSLHNDAFDGRQDALFPAWP